MPEKLATKAALKIKRKRTKEIKDEDLLEAAFQFEHDMNHEARTSTPGMFCFGLGRLSSKCSKGLRKKLMRIRTVQLA